MEAKLTERVEKDDVLMDDAEIGGSHPGNGYFSGLLLQKSRDFAHCNTEQEEKEIGAIVWAKVAEERQGRFLVSDSESDQFIVLNKASVVRKIRKAFKDLLPMARKKPRLEQPARTEPTATVSPGAGSNSRRLVWTEEESPDFEKTKTVGPSDTTDTGSETESHTGPRLPMVSSPNSGISSPINDPQEDSKSTKSASSAEEEEPRSPGSEKAQSSTDSVSGAKKEAAPSADDKMHRMLFKQLRALHREVRDMKQDNAMLHQDVSRLTKDCGAFQREILALKKTRGHLQHELIELRNNHKALLSVIRNDQASARVPDHLARPAPDLRKEDMLQQDLYELKRRLKEQQRLTDSLLDGAPSMSPGGGGGGRMDHLDPSLLLGRQGGYGIGASDLPVTSDSLRRAQNNEDLMRGLKRKSPSRGWH